MPPGEQPDEPAFDPVPPGEPPRAAALAALGPLGAYLVAALLWARRMSPAQAVLAREELAGDLGALLMAWKLPPLFVVVVTALGGASLGVLGTDAAPGMLAPD